MKKRLTLTLVATALAAATSLAAAGYLQRQRAQVTEAQSLAASDIMNRVAMLGLRPTTQALRRGPYYVLHAIDRHGIEVRVVADAQLGDVVSVTPLLTPRLSGGPRIIHVPQPGEGRDRPLNSRARNYEDDEAAVPDDADEDATPPPPRRPAVKKPLGRMEAPPARASVEPELEQARPAPKPLGPPRTLLSAPPPTGSLTPVYPTPKFDARSQPTEKFAPQD